MGNVYRIIIWKILFSAAILSAQESKPQVTSESPASPKKWVLVWSDEFNGLDGSPPDPAKWKFDTGGKGWGNNELETYTDRAMNAEQEGGNLVITARKESFTGPDGIAREYTSARLKTAGLFDYAYGRFEARIKIPYGQGIWPAFWLLGNDIGTVGWPQCGEIDIMENIGKEPSTIHGTIHGPGYSGEKGIGSPFSLPKDQKFSKDFHVFGVEWEPSQIRFYVDDNLYATRTPTDLPTGAGWVYDHPFFIILNLAVGGYWPGNPDATTVFPQQMLVDYVRVYGK
ncbi:MAG TPA: glycoside hydrolase family 16 protein [Terriglobales bacterium]|nr:glycoside hydrolase family 16 protein [Terriglobales bacterium]